MKMTKRLSEELTNEWQWKRIRVADLDSVIVVELGTAASEIHKCVGLFACDLQDQDITRLILHLLEQLNKKRDKTLLHG